MAGKDDGWIDASHRQPTHGHKVLALQQKENDGYTPEAGYNGKPCAWVIARWIQNGIAGGSSMLLVDRSWSSAGGVNFPTRQTAFLSSRRILFDIQDERVHCG